MSPASSRVSNPAPSYLPSLPPELWIRILTYNSDLTHIWSACRQVSQSFRAFAEQAFAETHLRHIVIYFHLDKYNLGGNARRPEVVTAFARFSTDGRKERVYFKRVEGGEETLAFSIKSKDDRSGKGKGKGKEVELRKSLLERWRQQVADIRPEIPNYVIQISDMANDTELPGLALDGSSGIEISFEWRAMLTAFFREQDRMRRLTKRWVGFHTAVDRQLESSPSPLQHRDVEPQIAESRRKVAAGEMTQADQLIWSAKLWSSAEKLLRKSIRRTRLKAHYKEAQNEEMVWAIKSMDILEGPPRSLKDIPGGRIGEKFFQSLYLPEYLLMDEWSSLQRIDTKAEMAAIAQGSS